MEYFNQNKFFSLDDFEHKTIFEDVDLVWNVFDKLTKYLENYPLGKIESKIPSECFVENIDEISIGKNCIIEKGSYIKGPCIIGDNSDIRHGAYIRGNVITGKGCIIGHSTEIKNSILLNNSKAAHFAYIGDSILGNNVNLGAGVKCANVRIDDREIIIFFENKRIKTFLKKMGAVIGDNVQIGCNTVLNPGTIIGKNAKCYACLNFGGVIPQDAIIKHSNKAVIKEKTKSNVYGKSCFC